MNKMKLPLLFNAFENIAIIAASVFASCYFGKPVLLAWMLLILLNSYSFKTTTKEDKNARDQI